MATYYVATYGSDSGSGSASSPWRTINKAVKANLKSGDEVVVKSGVYKESVIINKDGSAAGDITVRSEVPGGARIDASGKDYGFLIMGDYVEIEGFNVYNASKSGIIGSKVHHVKITDNISHDNSTGGILFQYSDFLTITGNHVYNNAKNAVISGISILHPENLTGSSSTSGYRIVISGNKVNNNKTINAAHTDGNGIILDDFKNTMGSGSPYTFPALIENNLIYSNGGSGIQIFRSDNITVRGNQSWHNNTDLQAYTTWRAEIQNTDSDNNTFSNNITVANENIHRDNSAIGNYSYPGEKNTNVNWYGNTTYNGTPGDASVQSNNGNSVPTTAGGNKLGVAPTTKAPWDSTASYAPAAPEPESPSTGTDDDGEVDTVTESPSANTLNGTSGNDFILGGDGNEVIDGKAGNDHLMGSGGNDHIIGGDGNDWVHGGIGKDLLYGGAGADVFAFHSAAGAGNGSQRDVIHDFSRSQGDKIGLGDVDANAKVSGDQAFTFIGSNGFSGSAGQLQYSNGLVAGDVNGDKVADFQIEIANYQTLGAGDFLL